MQTMGQLISIHVHNGIETHFVHGVVIFSQTDTDAGFETCVPRLSSAFLCNRRPLVCSDIGHAVVTSHPDEACERLALE